MDKPWISHYMEGVPAEVDVKRYNSIPELFDECFKKFGERPAFTNMERSHIMN